MSTRISSASRHHPLHHRRRTLGVSIQAQRFLAAFEGFEGGFAIGSSIVVALALAGLNHDVLILTAIISIIVNGFNNACVKYSSEHYLDQLDGREKRSRFKHYFIPSLIEFISYFAISFVTVVPLFFIPNVSRAVMISIAITLLLLFIAGYWRAYMLHMARWRDAVETVLIGSGIITVGLCSGLVLQALR